jgi:hypothetical protein
LPHQNGVHIPDDPDAVVVIGDEGCRSIEFDGSAHSGHEFQSWQAAQMNVRPKRLLPEWFDLKAKKEPAEFLAPFRNPISGGELICRQVKNRLLGCQSLGFRNVNIR